MVPNALCPPQPSHQPLEHGRQWGGCGDVTVGRGQWVAAEGLRAGGRWWQESHHCCPPHRGEGAGQASHGAWGQGLVVQAPSPAGDMRVPCRLWPIWQRCPSLGPSRAPCPGSHSPRGPQQTPATVGVAGSGTSPHPHPCTPRASLCVHPGRCPTLSTSWFGLVAPPAWSPMAAKPMPGGQPRCRGAGCSPLSEGRVHWAGGSAAGRPPASQSQRFLVVVVYL